MHGQTSQPLGSFGEEKTQIQVSVHYIFLGEEMFPLMCFSQLTSTCSFLPVTWPVHSCITLQAASIGRVQPALW